MNEPSLITVPVSDIRLPQTRESANKKKSPIVKHIAEDFKRGIKFVHEPVVRPSPEGGYELIAGERRLLGAIKAGESEVTVKCGDYSDRVAKEIRLIENAHRTHDKRVQGEEWEKLVELRQAIPTVFEEEPLGPGRPKGAKTKAREAVAKQKGVNPETVRKGEYRARKRREAGSSGSNHSDEPTNRPPEPSFLDLPEEPELRPEEKSLAPELPHEVVLPAPPKPEPPWPDPTGTGRALVVTHGFLSSALTEAWKVSEATELRKAIGHALELAGNILPAGACTYCNADRECQECGGRGWLPEEQLKESQKDF